MRGVVQSTPRVELLCPCFSPGGKELNPMSQLAVGPRKNIERQNWTEITPQALYDKCLSLAKNLWWSWHPEVVNLFRELDPIKWRKIDHNPIVLLAEMTPEQLAERAAEMVLYTRINQAHRRLKEYLTNTRTTWGARETGVLGSKPVAYFSAEFGLHESVPIYSGGLGVLSGDHIKSASSLGVPLVAIGLFYDQGYFKQHLDGSGYQQEEYQDTRVENLPMEPAIGADGKQVTISIETRDGGLMAKVWLMHVGRVPLYLLDCDVEGNSPQDRELTSRLYGGDVRTRIRQELVLGVGGVEGAAGAGHHAGRVSPQRRPQRVCAAGSDSPADGRRRADVRRSAARSGPSHGVHDAHAGAGRARSVSGESGGRAFGSAARQARHFAGAADGPGPRRAAKRARAVLHDGDRPEAFAAGQRRELAARPRVAADVGPFVAVARGGRNPHRPHHQRRAHSDLARLPDAPAVRPRAAERLAGMDGRRQGLAERCTTSIRASCGKRTAI